MAGSPTALALISICIVVFISGLGDCRIPFESEQLVREKEQSVHLLLPTEEEFNGIAREMGPLSLPLERPDLRGNDGIFQGERSRRFRFGRPGGCHHGRFKPWGHRMKEDMRFPFEFPGGRARFTDFHPRVDRPLPEENDFDRGFSNGEGRQERHGHPDEEKREKEGEHMPFPASREWPEPFFHPFPAHSDNTEFHPRVDEFWPQPREREFGDGFPKGGEGRQHREEENGERVRDNEHMPFTKEQTEPFSHVFPVQAESAEFHSRVEEFLPLPRERDFHHGFPGRDGRQPRHGHGHGEEEKEKEYLPFPTKGETEFEHSFPGGEGRQARHRHGHGEEEKGEEERRGPYVMEEKFKTE